MGDMLSQAEINALLGGELNNTEENKDANKDTTDEENDSTVNLTGEEKDILGEIGNISMGTSATTLYALLGEKVLITTPKVSVVKWNKLADGYSRPCVGIRVDYKEGIEGSNVLILRDDDVKIISNLMMGGTGSEDMERELNEIDLSAIAEAMNQMVGSASTSLASLVKMRIDIDTPRAFILDFADNKFNENVSFAEEDVVSISFRMQIGTLVDSEIMQILPMKFALDMVNIMRGEVSTVKIEETPTAQKNEPQQQENIPPQPQAPPQQVPPQQQYQQQPQMQYQQPPQMQYQQPPQPQYQQNVNVQPAQFQNFDISSVMQQKENIGIIMDVPLEVTVELGRTSKKIKEILEFSPGTVIELDKLAGEPIDILVNGKNVAKGEVVVIDENFGIRINEVISVENRI